MQYPQRWISAMPVVAALLTTTGHAQTTFRGPFGAAEWKASANPLRPGEPGQAPFWNVFGKRFIYAPAFDFHRVEKAVRYRFEITSVEDASVHTFENEVPWAPLRLGGIGFDPVIGPPLKPACRVCPSPKSHSSRRLCI